VTATYLDKTETTLFVVDPPNDDGYEEPSDFTEPEPIRIEDPVRFQSWIEVGQQVRLLAWAGQYGDAVRLAESTGFPLEVARPAENVKQEERETKFGLFQGRSLPAFPEIGDPKIRVFTGLRAEVMENVRSRIWGLPKKPSEANTSVVKMELPLNLAIGMNGSCLIIEGPGLQ
jgi:hypothetical protein